MVSGEAIRKERQGPQRAGRGLRRPAFDRNILHNILCASIQRRLEHEILFRLQPHARVHQRKLDGFDLVCACVRAPRACVCVFVRADVRERVRAGRERTTASSVSTSSKSSLASENDSSSSTSCVTTRSCRRVMPTLSREANAMSMMASAGIPS